MSGFDTVHLLWGIGALVLVISALAVRRVSIGFVVKSLLAWALIALVLFLIFDRREEIGAIARGGLESLGIAEQTVDGDTVRIRRSADGHYWASASIDGVDKRLLIDSGATLTVLSERTAEEAGIEPVVSGFPVVLQTAGGAMTARRGTIDTLTIGNMTMRDVAVVILPGEADLNVIGMNVLSRLHGWRVEQGVLILEPTAPTSATDAVGSGSGVET
ncbi:retropepsin-like aspartic protease family protein [Sphingomonas sp. AX6]|uniref:retropepsin-like aspartic protease family protein n=1 Tax=Sphingomonas sp. AX6 TaxID=2653171 RepID=UPI0012EFAED6|nr:TIGR02281 family clan AA aspartic protease [Sphingomonas sp. AX6]VXC96443.1 conserved hypothetical protein [Sphingomonas sp. AX6]